MRNYLLIGLVVFLIQGKPAHAEKGCAGDRLHKSGDNSLSFYKQSQSVHGDTNAILQIGELSVATGYLFKASGSVNAVVNEETYYNFVRITGLLKYLQKNGRIKAYLAHIHPSHSYW